MSQNFCCKVLIEKYATQKSKIGIRIMPIVNLSSISQVINIFALEKLFQAFLKVLSLLDKI